MATKCPRCGSKNTKCINRGEQAFDFGLRFTAAAVCSAVGAMFGHPNIGKNVGGIFVGPLKDSIYICKSCGNTFIP